jgi:hypothetical protein
MYVLLDAPLSWDSAESACAALAPGAHLASIHSDAELAFMSRLNTIGAAQRWIGASLMRSASPQTPPFVFGWADGTVFDYSLFKQGQPDDLGGSEGCIQIDSSQPAQWYDASCSLARPAVCKRPGLLMTCIDWFCLAVGILLLDFVPPVSCLCSRLVWIPVWPWPQCRSRLQRLRRTLDRSCELQRRIHFGCRVCDLYLLL